MKNDCTIEKHEADKMSPHALETHYDSHGEPWRFDDESLAMYTCRRCKSTICIPVLDERLDSYLNDQIRQAS
jgi:hypothetical protein